MKRQIETMQRRNKRQQWQSYHYHQQIESGQQQRNRSIVKVKSLMPQEAREPWAQTHINHKNDKARTLN